MERYSYNKQRKLCQNLYQLVLFIVLTASLTFEGILHSYGLQFLLSHPQTFECFKSNEWESCSLAEVCEIEGPYVKDRNLFRIGSNEISNLSDKFMIFCMEKTDQQQFKLFAFGGILISLLFAPSLADKFGRKNVLSFCLAASVLA